MQSPHQPVASSSRGISLPASPEAPQPILTTDHAVAQWPSTPGFKGFWAWIRRRCERIKGRDIIAGDHRECAEPVDHLLQMLDSMINWVEEVPPQLQSNQRFGNLAFRDYIKLVEKRLPALLSSPPLPPSLPGQLVPLLLHSTAFGQPTRLDYGTGHELAFVLGLWCCVVSGWVGGEGREDEEDDLVLRVFARYLDLVTLLQQMYRLEPAGSHGVWGLDDYCFFPYLFGSAQLLDSTTSPAQALQNALNPTTPIKDFYTLSLNRISLFKKGAAFSEHSPLLFQLSEFPSWQKPFGGLQKMFLGEVAGKRVVVQGLWVGGWCWGEDMPGTLDGDEEGRAGGVRGTKAPWAAGRPVANKQEVLDMANQGWASLPPRR